MDNMFGQTIMVVNKSGKVVSTSKHLVNMFNEAKSAYRERKAELRASKKGATYDTLEQVSRRDSRASSRDERERQPKDSSKATKSRKSPSRDYDDRSRRHRRSSSEHGDAPSSQRRSPPDNDRHHRRSSTAQEGTSRRHRGPSSAHPSMQRVYSDSLYDRDRGQLHKSSNGQTSRLRYEQKASSNESAGELARRRSYPDEASIEASHQQLQRLSMDDDVDMDLAYGELPPALPERPQDDQKVLREKVTTLNRLLEEANCLQYSAKAIVKNLEGNPEAMAAVALTLAEISNIVTKLGPTALTSLKTAFPTVLALLLSSEFLIAAGVGVGITIVAFGGYKIIKRIKTKKEAENETEEQELEELSEDMQRIEGWRRGIADIDAQSIGTSVEGEFITPGASKQLQENGLQLSTKSKKEASEEKKKQKKEKEYVDKKAKREKEDEERRLKREKEDEKRRQKRDKEDASFLSLFKKSKLEQPSEV